MKSEHYTPAVYTDDGSDITNFDVEAFKKRMTERKKRYVEEYSAGGIAHKGLGDKPRTLDRVEEARQRAMQAAQQAKAEYQQIAAEKREFDARTSGVGYAFNGGMAAHPEDMQRSVDLQAQIYEASKRASEAAERVKSLEAEAEELKGIQTYGSKEAYEAEKQLQAEEQQRFVEAQQNWEFTHFKKRLDDAGVTDPQAIKKQAKRYFNNAAQIDSFLNWSEGSHQSEEEALKLRDQASEAMASGKAERLKQAEARNAQPEQSKGERLRQLNREYSGTHFVAVGPEGDKHIIPVSYIERYENK